MKKITLLLILLVSAFSGSAQPEWRQITDNPNLISASSYDIAVGNEGMYYACYTLYNGTTGVYDIYLDYYTYQTGWSNMLTYPTTNNVNISIKSVRSGSNIYAIANTNTGDELTTFQISGNTAYMLNASNFSYLTTFTDWSFDPGVSATEFYVSYLNAGSSLLYAFDYNTGLWTMAGYPLQSQAIYASEMDVFVNQDSVFVAGRYNNGLTDRIKISAAQKGVWTWASYDPSGSDVYSYNGMSNDTVETNSGFNLLGTNSGFLRLVCQDNGSPEEIILSSNTYGAPTTFPLHYDNSSVFGQSASTAYIMATDPSVTDHHVVCARNLESASYWNQVTMTSFAPNSVNALYKKIQTADLTDRVGIAYRDTTPNPDVFGLLLTNTPPVITSNGNASSTICAGNNASLINTMTVFDNEQDILTLVGVNSTNDAVIDPASVNVNIYNTNNGNFEVYADASTADVSADENVSLTFTFTDGFDQIQHQIDVVVHPTPDVSMADDTLTFCNNGDIVDLYEFASPQGGDFSFVEGNYDGHYFDPAEITDPSTYLLELYYSYTDGTCSSWVQFHITGWDAPVATITTTPSTNCNSADGTAQLEITGGTAPINYTWSIGNYTDQILYNLNPISLHADVTDANGCFTAADGVVANNGVTISATITDVDCHGNTNGAIDLSVSGMVPPLTVLWSNGYSTEDISNLAAGAHEVWITDDAGCSASQIFTVHEPDALQLYIYGNGTPCGEQQGTVEISLLEGGVMPYNYLWNTGATAVPLTNVGSGIYTLTVTDNNGCQTFASAGVWDENAPYAYNPIITDAGCNTEDGSIEVYSWSPDPSIHFEWSNGATTEDNPHIPAGDYTLHVYNDSNCHTYSVFTVGTIAPDRQPICVVTVDSATATNLVVWEKIGDLQIDYYKIFRETSVAGQYMLIDTVDNNNLSIFNDVVASPVARSWQYRISAVNECQVEGIPSEAHKTIHLTAEDLGNGDFKVIWNAYQGTEYTAYTLYRFTSSTGWNPINTIPAGTTVYLDSPGPDIAGLDYMVDFELAESCTAEVTRAQDFNSSRSNKDKAAFSPGDGTGDSNNGLIEQSFGDGTVMLYPNPVTGERVFLRLNGTGTLQYTIQSITGQVVADGQASEGITTLTVENLRPGMYLLRLHNESEHAGIRFIIE